MKLPQLVQEIIDYYLWKAKIVECNIELGTVFDPTIDGGVLTNKGFKYNKRWLGRNIWRIPSWKDIYRYNFHLQKRIIPPVGVTPERYRYSNTKEQLKSLFLSQDN